MYTAFRLGVRLACTDPQGLRVRTLANTDEERYMNIARWLDNVLHDVRISSMYVWMHTERKLLLVCWHMEQIPMLRTTTDTARLHMAPI